MYNGQWKQDKWLNENFFKNKKNGFFIDIGAHDGITFNNSLYFEKNLDWKGICVEPIPEVYEKLRENRNCICVHGCIYNKDGDIELNWIKGYSEMLSGISEAYCDKHKNRIENEIKIYGGESRKIFVDCFKLNTILNIYDIKHVDMLCIDTEGSELQILEGIDFEKVKIDLILVEVNYKEDEKNINNFLIEKGYTYIIKIGGDNVYVK